MDGPGVRGFRRWPRYFAPPPGPRPRQQCRGIGRSSEPVVHDSGRDRLHSVQVVQVLRAGFIRADGSDVMARGEELVAKPAFLRPPGPGFIIVGEERKADIPPPEWRPFFNELPPAIGS